MTDLTPLGAGLARVAVTLGGTTLRLTGTEGETKRRTLHTMVTGYLIPKVTDPGAALVTVVVGPTGSGKSTLVNAMAGDAVAAAGPLRPTTRSPVVWAGEELPANLVEVWPPAAERVTAGLRSPPEGMVVVDAPPPGVVSADGTEIDALLLEIADVCVFVASERRYADAAAWRLLDIAARRRRPVVFVLNRLTGDAPTQRLLREDMARHLVRRGLLDRLHPEEVIGIEEVGAPSGVRAATLRKELESLADPQARRGIVEAGIQSGVADLQRSLIELRSVVAGERRCHRDLLRLTVDAYDSESAAARSALVGGDLAELSRDPERVIVDLASIVTRRATAAARRTATAWEAHPVGRSLLQREPSLWTHGVETPRRSRDTIGAWVDSLPALAVRPSGRRMPRRWRRRIAGAAMRASLDPKAHATGRLGRRIAGISDLTDAARRGLAEAVAGVLESDRSRFTAILGDEIPASLDERLWLRGGGEP